MLGGESGFNNNNNIIINNMQEERVPYLRERIIKQYFIPPEVKPPSLSPQVLRQNITMKRISLSLFLSLSEHRT